MVSPAGALGIRCTENLGDPGAEVRIGSGSRAWEARASGLQFWIARIEIWALASVWSRLERPGCRVQCSVLWDGHRTGQTESLVCKVSRSQQLRPSGPWDHCKGARGHLRDHRAQSPAQEKSSERRGGKPSAYHVAGGLYQRPVSWSDQGYTPCVPRAPEKNKAEAPCLLYFPHIMPRPQV